jgi:probable HAF family extracellular repeat protein
MNKIRILSVIAILAILTSFAGVKPVVGAPITQEVICASNAMIDLGFLSYGRPPTPRAINDVGQIVGAYTRIDGIWRSFIWQDGVMTDLGDLGGDTTEWASDINN